MKGIFIYGATCYMIWELRLRNSFGSWHSLKFIQFIDLDEVKLARQSHH